MLSATCVYQRAVRGMKGRGRGEGSKRRWVGYGGGGEGRGNRMGKGIKSGGDVGAVEGVIGDKEGNEMGRREREDEGEGK